MDSTPLTMTTGDMAKKIILFLLIFLFLGTTIVLIGVFSGQNKPATNINTDNSETKKPRTSFVLPMQSRNYAVGTSGFFPVNFPNQNATETAQYFKDIEATGEIYGVHTSVEELNILNTIAGNVKTDINLVTGIKDDNNWSSMADRFINNLTPYLEKYPRIKYVAIGNEINNHFNVNTAKFNNFLNSYKTIYSKLKQKFPDLKIYTTFQYETLIGKGYLTGDKFHKPNIEIFKTMEPLIDLVGLTTYPYFDYKTPQDLPSDYFKGVRNLSSKKLAITETGWMVRTELGHPTVDLYAGSENEQYDYLKKLVEILNNEKVEFVTWFGVNDIVEIINPKAANPGLLYFDSISLRYHEGKEKKIWDLWLELYTIEIQ